jgi:hypothetical protein
VKEDMMAYHLLLFGTFVATEFIVGFAAQARANASFAWVASDEPTLKVI